MGFYGNITNTSRTQFTFDATYANRAEMDARANTDGIYIGRFVLVEYDTSMAADWCTDVYKSKGVFYTSANKEDSSKIVYGYGNIVEGKYLRVPAAYTDPTTRKEIIHNFDHEADNKYKDLIYLILPSTIGEAPNVKIMSETDSKYVENYQIDMRQYGEGRGYDSTVWQKVYTDNHERYVMIAELNTVVPTFGISADAPTLSPITPHFDVDSSNVYYKVHWQPAWGLRIKSAAKNITSPLLDDDGKSIGGSVELSTPMDYSLLSDEKTGWYRTVYNPSTGAFKDLYYSSAVNADTLETSGEWIERAGVNNTETVPAAIYYNKAGFNPEYITYSNSDLPVGMNPIVDKIALEPTGKSGYVYNKHDGTINKEAQIDTQELSILLPSIGNTIAKIWDLVYGNEKLTGSRNRNLNIKWSNGSISPDLSGLRLVTKSKNGYGYEPNQVSTIAGAINSVHDLMGMIIREYDESDLDENYIYYKSDEEVYGRRAKLYEYNPVVLTNNKFSKENRFNEVQFSEEGIGYYADYASSNPKDPHTSKTYPNYIYSDSLSDNGKLCFKTVQVDESKKITGDKLSEGVFEPYKFFVLNKKREVTIGSGENTTTVETESYQVSLDTTFKANTNYLQIEYQELPSNTRFYQSGVYYRPEFEGPFTNHEHKNFENGELFELINGRYVRPTSYVIGAEYYTMKKPIMPFSGTVIDTEQYFEVNSRVENGDTVLVERSYYEKDLSVNADNFLSRPRYTTEDQVVYTLANRFIVGTIYYNRITSWEQQTDTISPSAMQEVKLIVFNEGPTIYHRIPKGGGGANGYEEFIKVTNNLIGYYKTNLVSIQIREISSVYGPNLYYYKVDSGALSESWIFDSNSTPTLGREYYPVSAITAGAVLEIANKYEPFKYYYKVNNDFILDSREQPAEGETYYIKQGLYVTNDTTGLYPYGTEWNINVETVPDHITLSEKVERWGFEELPGFARNMNTIHGLILKLNNMLEFGDPDIRDYTTAQGLMNKLRDIILQFGEIYPDSIMITDSYGKIIAKTLESHAVVVTDENHKVTSKVLRPDAIVITDANNNIDSKVLQSHAVVVTDGDNKVTSKVLKSDAIVITDADKNIDSKELDPHTVVVTDDEGKINSQKLLGDNWISPTLDNTQLSIKHTKNNNVSEDSIDGYTINPIGEDCAPIFGGSIILQSNKIEWDSTGHLINGKIDTENRYKITLPDLQVKVDESNEVNNSSVIVGIKGEAETNNPQMFTISAIKENIGELLLTGYTLDEELDNSQAYGEDSLVENLAQMMDYTKISEADSINQAFAKVNTALTKITNSVLLTGYNQHISNYGGRKNALGLKEYEDTIGACFAKVNGIIANWDTDLFTQATRILGIEGQDVNTAALSPTVDERIEQAHENVIEYETNEFTKTFETSKYLYSTKTALIHNGYDDPRRYDRSIDNGITWTESSITNIESDAAHIKKSFYSNGHRLVSIGRGGHSDGSYQFRISTTSGSTNNWQTLVVYSDSSTVSAVNIGATDVFVRIGSVWRRINNRSGQILHFPDNAGTVGSVCDNGTNWVAKYRDDSDVNGRFCYAYSSDSGLSWIQITKYPDGIDRSAVGNTLITARGWFLDRIGNIIVYSKDNGKTWNSITLPDGYDYTYNSSKIIYRNDYYIVPVADESAPSKTGLLFSYNLIDWNYTQWFGTDKFVDSMLAAYKNKFYAIKDYTYTNSEGVEVTESRLHYSDDLQTWEKDVLTFRNIDSIKPVLGDSYKISEVETNNTWIDGKPIYRQVITCLAIGKGSYLDLNVSGKIDNIISLTGIAKSQSGYFPIGYANNSSVNNQIALYFIKSADVNASSSIVRISTGSGCTIDQATIIIEYTKQSN